MLFRALGITVLGLTLLPSAQAASVATSSSQATAAARKVLENGGSAADAACAAVLVLNVTQPYFTGIGSGGLALVSTPKATEYFDFRERAPMAVTPELFEKSAQAKSSWNARTTGGRSVGIPGVVAGCGELIEKYGKQGWKQAFQPALDVAIGGYKITQMWSEELAEQWKRISPFPFTQSFFGGQDGTGLKKDEVLLQPELASTLETLSHGKPEDFYRGELARNWLSEARSIPGADVLITEADLAQYRVRHAAPVRARFGNLEIETAGLPSAAGLMVASTLRFLDWYHGRHGRPGPSSVTRYILELEASAHFASIRKNLLADASKSLLDPVTYAGSAAEADAFAKIERKVQERLENFRANRGKTVDACKVTRAPVKHTAHISVVDDEGMAVSMTTSLGTIFGSGILLPKHGFLLNNQMSDFEEQAGLPNSPAGGLAPRSNMSPLLIYQAGTRNLLGTIGAAGGSYIPSSLVQFIENYYIYGMDAKAALAYEFGRAHTSDGGKSVEIEKTAPAAVIEGLRRAKYCIDAPVDFVWAVVEATIRRETSTSWSAVHEPRYNGDSWSTGDAL
jgi:gamma-glutamyltranspeptidase/glutathione hydrolase